MFLFVYVCFVVGCSWFTLGLLYDCVDIVFAYLFLFAVLVDFFALLAGLVSCVFGYWLLLLG